MRGLGLLVMLDHVSRAAWWQQLQTMYSGSAPEDILGACRACRDRVSGALRKEVKSHSTHSQPDTAILGDSGEEGNARH